MRQVNVYMYTALESLNCFDDDDDYCCSDDDEDDDDKDDDNEDDVDDDDEQCNGNDEDDYATTMTTNLTVIKLRTIRNVMPECDDHDNDNDDEKNLIDKLNSHTVTMCAYTCKYGVHIIKDC